MNFDEYVAARYGRLIEHAVLLGCAEGEAGTVVDQVLVAERRRIRRAKDPDPLVREALEQSVRGEPIRRRHGGPLAAVALVAGVAIVGLVATYQPAPSTQAMPSLFGYDGPHAATYLHQLGLGARIVRVSGCEPLGQVIGSQPEPGETVQEGSTVMVRTSLPSDSFCLPDYDDHVTAWAFVGFALGGSAPDFARQVTVLDATSGGAGHTLSTTQAREPDQWGEVLETVARASRTRVSSISGMAVLDVNSLTPPGRFCGQQRPVLVDRRDALRLQIDVSGEGDAPCPLTVDLYRDDDHRIDTVVLYAAAP